MGKAYISMFRTYCCILTKRAKCYNEFYTSTMKEEDVQ